MELGKQQNPGPYPTLTESESVKPGRGESIFLNSFPDVVSPADSVFGHH